MDSQDENLDNLQRAIRALEKIVVTVKTEAPVAVTEVRHKINAPAIKLLTFDGTTAEFAPFWDNFESQIGKRTDLSAVDKLAYLKGQLKGTALADIKDYPSIEANYAIAVELLKGRYGDVKRIKRDLAKNLMSMVEAKHQPSELSKVLTCMERSIRGFENLGADVKSAEWLAVELVRSRLSPTTLQLMQNLTGTACETLDTIRKGIHSTINHLEESITTEKRQTKVETKPSPDPSKSSKEKSGSNSHWQRSDVGNYVVMANPKPANTATSSAVSSKSAGHRTHTYMCRFCAGIHRDSFCSQYPTLGTRKKRLEELGRCIKCIGLHPGVECQFNFQTCLKCGVGKHHIALCDAFASTTTVPVAVKSELPSRSRAPLLTVMATVSSPTHEIPVRMFLDTGAQQPLIHDKVAKDLRLEPIRQDELSIEGINGEWSKKSYDVVKVKVVFGTDVRDIEAVVFNRLPSIRAAGLANAVRHLKEQGVPMADPDIQSDEINDIGLLVGCDYFHRVARDMKEVDGIIDKVCNDRAVEIRNKPFIIQ